MLTYESVVTGIFRWFDLVVMALGVYYGAQRWIIPFLKEKKQSEQNLYQELEHKIIINAQEVERLAQQIVQDGARSAQLQQKVLLWQVVCAQEKLAHMKNQEALVVRLQEQNDIKNTYFVRLAQDKAVVKEAIEQSEQAIRERFCNPDQAQLCMRRAITCLKEGAATWI